MRGLRDRVAVVTGAGRGIGAASARRLAAEGAAVVVTDRDEHGAIEVAAAIQALGGRAISAPADSRRRSDLEAVVTLAREQFGSFDLLHHNAGVGCFGPLESTTEDQIAELVDINVLGMINGLAVAAPALRSGGRGVIVLTGSLVAQHGTAFQIPYIATKGAVSSMTRAAAMEFAPEVRVNAVCPGTVRTEGLLDTFGDPAILAAIERNAATIVPLGRMAEPEEIASVVAFLASDDAAYITGEIITAGGGWSAGTNVSLMLAELGPAGSDPSGSRADE